METLFEVKASSDGHSWFTALGRLLVYGAEQVPPPKESAGLPCAA